MMRSPVPPGGITPGSIEAVVQPQEVVTASTTRSPCPLLANSTLNVRTSPFGTFPRSTSARSRAMSGRAGAQALTIIIDHSTTGTSLFTDALVSPSASILREKGIQPFLEFGGSQGANLDPAQPPILADEECFGYSLNPERL